MTTNRLLFIGGLHRSGTTPLTSVLARHPQVSGFTGTGVHADEGQHLQSTYSSAYDHGGPGSFAFDAEAHLVEVDPASASIARRNLWAAWQPHWDTTCTMLVEKSPPNLVRFRYLQSVFPEAYCLAILRHPAAVAFATRSMRRKPLDHLLRHWLHAHTIFLDDARHVRNLAVIHYESLVEDPEATLSDVCKWLGIAPATFGDDLHDENERYFARWRSQSWGLRRSRSRKLVDRFDTDVTRFGYSLSDLSRTPVDAPHRLRSWQLSGPLPTE